MGSFLHSCARIATLSLAKEAAQIVKNPFTVGRTFVAVDIPTTFCVRVERARVAPKAAKPDSMGIVSSMVRCE